MKTATARADQATEDLGLDDAVDRAFLGWHRWTEELVKRALSRAALAVRGLGALRARLELGVRLRREVATPPPSRAPRKSDMPGRRVFLGRDRRRPYQTAARRRHRRSREFAVDLQGASLGENRARGRTLDSAQGVTPRNL